MFLRRFLVWLLWLPVAGFATTGERLRVSWGVHNAPPYALVEDGRLTGGVIHDVGTLLARELGLDAEFVEVPRARYEEQLRNGAIHLVCITHPAWLQRPEDFAWSPPLFSEADIIVQAAGTTPWRGYHDLAGKRLGTILGYTYPSLEAWFASGRVQRDDAATLASNLQRLSLGRVDAVVDANIPAWYWLIQHNQLGRYPLAAFTVSRHDVHCALSPAFPGGTARGLAALRRLQAPLRESLARYLTPP